MSIICLMMSLLLPSLTHAQKQGEQIHCLANQHQLILAWLQYAIEHDDKLCPPDSHAIDPNGTAGFPGSYASRLRPYVQMKEVFQCKSAGQTSPGEGVGLFTRNNSYGLSNAMGGELRDGVEPFLALHMVSRPSERMVLVDKEPECSDCFWPLLRNGKQWTWRPWSWPAFATLQGMTGRHNNGCNMSFADGHGEYTLWKDPRTRKVIKGLIADPNDATFDNVDLEYLVTILAHRS
jgi:prepilin-type processing-associated H-X9-DG protein